MLSKIFPIFYEGRSSGFRTHYSWKTWYILPWYILNTPGRRGRIETWPRCFSGSEWISTRVWIPLWCRERDSVAKRCTPGRFIPQNLWVVIWCDEKLWWFRIEDKEYSWRSKEETYPSMKQFSSGPVSIFPFSHDTADAFQIQFTRLTNPIN